MPTKKRDTEHGKLPLLLLDPAGPFWANGFCPNWKEPLPHGALILLPKCHGHMTGRSYGASAGNVPRPVVEVEHHPLALEALVAVASSCGAHLVAHPLGIHRTHGRSVDAVHLSLKMGMTNAIVSRTSQRGLLPSDVGSETRALLREDALLVHRSVHALTKQSTHTHTHTHTHTNKQTAKTEKANQKTNKQ